MAAFPTQDDIRALQWRVGALLARVGELGHVHYMFRDYPPEQQQQAVDAIVSDIRLATKQLSDYQRRIWSESHLGTEAEMKAMHALDLLQRAVTAAANPKRYIVAVAIAARAGEVYKTLPALLERDIAAQYRREGTVPPGPAIAPSAQELDFDNQGTFIAAALPTTQSRNERYLEVRIIDTARATGARLVTGAGRPYKKKTPTRSADGGAACAVRNQRAAADDSAAPPPLQLPGVPPRTAAAESRRKKTPTKTPPQQQPKWSPSSDESPDKDNLAPDRGSGAVPRRLQFADAPESSAAAEERARRQ